MVGNGRAQRHTARKRIAYDVVVHAAAGFAAGLAFQVGLHAFAPERDFVPVVRVLRSRGDALFQVFHGLDRRQPETLGQAQRRRAVTILWMFLKSAAFPPAAAGTHPGRCRCGSDRAPPEPARHHPAKAVIWSKYRNGIQLPKPRFANTSSILVIAVQHNAHRAVLQELLAQLAVGFQIGVLCSVCNSTGASTESRAPPARQGSRRRSG
ncbi:MAG: hypothetical protein HS108_12470 [Planctomycetes bacterium]|nr:hypothetical protein [Planctomycetota bacterium]